MRYYLLVAVVVTTIANGVMAQTIDVIGGRDSSTQTMHHCGYLPTMNVVYTTGPVATRIIQEKLAALGYYHAALDGVNGRATKAAVRRFQSEYGLAVDGVVGINTSQHLAYFTHASANPRRCWRLAQNGLQPLTKSQPLAR